MTRGPRTKEPLEKLAAGAPARPMSRNARASPTRTNAPPYGVPAELVINSTASLSRALETA